MDKSIYIWIPALSLFSILSLAQSSSSSAHDISISIPEVAMVDVESTSGTGVNFTFIEPDDAGMALTSTSSNNNFWLNYSSTVSSSTFHRSITAQLNHSLSGIDVLLFAQTPNTGSGDLGNSVGQVTLSSNTAQTILTNIGTCFTGNGPGNGSQLTYALNMHDIRSTYIMNTSLKVTFTITEEG